MSRSLAIPPPATTAVHRYAVAVAMATFVLIVAGAHVTSTESGLAVPDWPLSYGRFFPPMVGGIFWEHGHRMIAGTVAILTLGLVLVLRFKEPRPWVRNLAYAAGLAILAQAILGGLTVKFFLPPPISVGHALLGQTFFCLIVLIAMATSPRWVDTRPAPGAAVPVAVASLAFAAIYLQLLLGAVMRHTDSGLAIRDFPLANGRLIPEFVSAKVAIHFAHRVWALVVAGLVLTLVLRVRAQAARLPALSRPALLAAALVVAQGVLGPLTVLTRKAPVATTAHVATGALLLATSLVVVVRAARLRPQPASGMASGLVPSEALS